MPSSTMHLLGCLLYTSFRRIEQRVAEGRWVPVGGWWVQPDCNLPSGESFARHSLLGCLLYTSVFWR